MQQCVPCAALPGFDVIMPGRCGWADGFKAGTPFVIPPWRRPSCPLTHRTGLAGLVGVAGKVNIEDFLCGTELGLDLDT